MNEKNMEKESMDFMSRYEISTAYSYCMMMYRN